MQRRPSDITLRRAEVYKGALPYLVSIIRIKQSRSMADNQLEPVQQTAFHPLQVAQ